MQSLQETEDKPVTLYTYYSTSEMNTCFVPYVVKFCIDCVAQSHHYTLCNFL